MLVPGDIQFQLPGIEYIQADTQLVEMGILSLLSDIVYPQGDTWSFLPGTLFALQDILCPLLDKLLVDIALEDIQFQLPGTEYVQVDTQ